MDLKDRLPQLFLGIAGIGFLCCFARSDFNLPLFLFIWMMWQDPNKVSFNQFQRVRMLFLMISTAIVDAFWIFYWGDA